jgi:hypothetical protein
MLQDKFYPYGHSELDIEVAQPLIKQHQILRQTVEQHFAGWRVLKIEQDSTTTYDYTEKTATQPHPEYIMAEAQAQFTIELVEDKPREIETSLNERLKLPLEHLVIRARLIANGKLLITQTRASIE